MMATRASGVDVAFAAASAASGAGAVPATSCSMMKRLICRIASGWSRCVRMQVFSHR
jgi:hypothetical protein